jgi:hypothetical protein
MAGRGAGGAGRGTPVVSCAVDARFVSRYEEGNWGPSWRSYAPTCCATGAATGIALPLTCFRHLVEMNVADEQRGTAHLGADFWPVIRDRLGNRRGRRGAGAGEIIGSLAL